MVYNKFINLSQDRKDTISKMIEKQDCGLWSFCRKIRLSGSRVSKVPKRESTDPKNFLEDHLYGEFRGNEATHHGNMCEPLAREAYMKDHDEVQVCGVVIHKEEPWLCASPDGLCGLNKIIEIKAPFNDNVPEVLSSGKYDVETDDSGNARLKVKGKNGYYYQVQVTMECTERSVCDFLVWDNSSSQVTVCSVPKDSQFLSVLMGHLRKFYFMHLLPKVVDDLHSGVLQIPRSAAKSFE